MKNKNKVLILIPFILSIIYVNYFFINIYQSNVVFSIRNIEDNGNSLNPLNLLSKNVDIPKSKNIAVLEKYLNSEEIFKELNKKFHLIDIYNDNSKTNIFDNCCLKYKEDYLELYRNNLEFISEDELVIMNFDSNDRNLSRDIVSFLLKKGEIFLNKLEENKIKKNLYYLKNDVIIKLKDFKKAEQELNNFQNKNQLISPELEFKSEYKFKSELKLEKIKKQSEYNVKKTYMNEKAPKLLEMKYYINELKNNINNINNNIYGNNKNKLISKMIKFEELKQKVKFKLEVYKSTLTNYELASIENNKNKEYIEVITKPTLPDKYIYPEKTKIVIIVLLVSLLLSYIFNSINKLIKEHKE